MRVQVPQCYNGVFPSLAKTQTQANAPRPPHACVTTPCMLGVGWQSPAALNCRLRAGSMVGYRGNYPRVRTPSLMPAGAGFLPAMISARRVLARSVTSITAFLTLVGFFCAGLFSAGRLSTVFCSTKADADVAVSGLLLRDRQACKYGAGA